VSTPHAFWHEEAHCLFPDLLCVETYAQIVTNVLSMDLSGPMPANPAMSMAPTGSRRRVSASDGVKLARALTASRSVTLLDLRWNALRADGAEALAQVLRANTSLTVVRVCGNEMGDVGITALADALVVNTTVQEWTAGDNGVGVHGGRAVFRMLATNTTLRVVDLKEHIMGSIGLELVDMLTRNRTLERLDVSRGMYLWGDAAVDEAIATARAANPRLTFVDR
jgi:hypothetical protein